MPELPEVETTVRYLRERISDQTIVGSRILWPRTIATHSPKSFSQTLSGLSISKVSRRGKYIEITLGSTRPLHLFIHLRMSGSLDVIAANNEIDTHDRVVLYLGNGKSLRFNDTRKFGRIYLCNNTDLISQKLGVEPLSKDFSPAVLFGLTRAKKARLKGLLLDQSVIAGLGNIYVDESLWKAKIHPCTPACAISLKQCQALHEAITSTLSEAIELAGTDFGDGVVQDGMYSPLVYGCENKPCKRCRTEIQKTRVQQRGTHFCPRCQAV
jgi:formamidopyrimidine-DNA glycosylase